MGYSQQGGSGYILTENPNYNSVSVEEAIRIVKQKKLNEDTGLKNPDHG
jgi:hypothetical protein